MTKLRTIALQRPRGVRSVVRILFGSLLLAFLTPSSAGAEPASPRQQALSSVKQGSATLLRGRFEDAESILGKALDSGALDYLDQVAALKNRGVARWSLRRSRAAIGDFNAAVKITPEDPALYNNRGNVLLTLGLTEEAIKDFDHSLLLSPYYAEAFNNRGNAHFRSGDYRAAVRDFSKAIRLMPENAVPFNGRGKAQLLLGRRFGAFRDLTRALTLNAAYATAHANRAKVLMALQRYEKAIEEYTLAIKLRPKSAPLHLDRGLAYAKLGKPGPALEDMTQAIEFDPAFATALAERSGVYDSMEKSDEATADLRAALDLDPQSVVGLAYLARSLVQAGAPAVARPTIEEALKVDPESALALQVRGEIWEALNQPKAAMADYRLALHYAPFQPESRSALRRMAAANNTVQAKEVGSPLDGWSVSLSPTNRYVVQNEDYSIRFMLEMYGDGEPKLLDWKMLKGALRRTGLLRYYAGSSADGKRMEYTALIDTRAGKLVGIEPVRWGEREAEWTWNHLAVVVEDPEGVPNRLELKGAPASATATARRRTTRQARQRRSGRPPSSGFLRWLFR